MSFMCPLDDGKDFPGSTNCGGSDFGSRLALDMHFAEKHLGAGRPVMLSLSGEKLPSDADAYADVLRALRPFVASVSPDFHGAPPVPRSHGWGELGSSAGIGLGLPQARYVIWSSGTPIAWYLNDSTDEGWVLPRGEYFTYDRTTSRHQNKIEAALALVGMNPNTSVARYDREWQ